MNHSIPEIERELTNAITQTIIALKNDYPDDHFYYFTLTTVEEALSPGHSIWSEELLEQEAKRQAKENDEDYLTIKEEIRYAYADSPLFYHYREYFKKVDALFLARPNIFDLKDEDYDKEFHLRINTMVEALKNADRKSIFGKNEERKKWFINVEINPPDGSNITRAKIFNSEDKIKEWLDWGGA